MNTMSVKNLEEMENQHREKVKKIVNLLLDEFYEEDKGVKFETGALKVSISEEDDLKVVICIEGMYYL